MNTIEVIGTLMLLIIAAFVVIASFQGKIGQSAELSFTQVESFLFPKPKVCTQPGYEGWTQEQFLDAYAQNPTTQELTSLHAAYLSCFGEALDTIEGTPETPSQYILSRAEIDLIDVYRKDNGPAYLTMDEAQNYLNTAQEYANVLSDTQLDTVGYPVLKRQAEILLECKALLDDINAHLAQESIAMHAIADVKTERAYEIMEAKREDYTLELQDLRARNPQVKPLFDEGKLLARRDGPLWKLSCLDLSQKHETQEEARSEMVFEDKYEEYGNAICNLMQQPQYDQYAERVYEQLPPLAQEACTLAYT